LTRLRRSISNRKNQKQQRAPRRALSPLSKKASTMSERRTDPIVAALSVYIMPIALAVAGWLAQNSYAQINKTLERIEKHQADATDNYHQLRERITRLEAMQAAPPQGLRLPPQISGKPHKY
jgi:hypothetical protein